MALTETEGFGFSTIAGDYVTYGALQHLDGDLTSLHTGGPLGDNYLEMKTYGTATAVKAFSVPASTFFFGARLRAAITASGGGFLNMKIMSFRDASGTEQFNLQLNTADQLTVNQGGTVLATLPASGMGTWRYIEIGGVISPTIGSITIRANGATILSVTGVNTQAASGNLIGQVAIGLLTGITDSGTVVQFTHLYFADNTGPAPWNTFLGDVRVQTLLPVSNDAVQFTPNGQAANWQNAALVPPVPGTDFNSDATVGDQDTFNCAALTAGLGAVFAVSVKSLFAINTAGSRSMQTVLKSGATTALGTAAVVGVSPSLQHTIYETDPNTSAPWTQANVNLAKPGYKISA